MYIHQLIKLSKLNFSYLCYRYGDDARAIYQNKASNAYFYYVVDNSEGYVGWAIGPTKNNGQTPVIKLSDRYVLKSLYMIF